MSNYAVLDIRTGWILSIHTSEELAYGRLRHYISAVLEGTDRSLTSVEKVSEPGQDVKSVVPHLRVLGVSEGARRREYYSGPLYDTSLLSPTKKLA